MRIVFFGTPAASVASLRALVESHHSIELVVTQPDRKRGRGGALSPSPVKRAAIDLGLAVRTPERCGEVLDELTSLRPDLGVVVAFGQLLPQPVLDAPRLGCVNVHFSLLPRWRGAAPVERAILAGDRETGVAIMAMEAGLDTGPVFAEQRVAIADRTAGELTDELVAVGAELLVDTVARIETIEPRPQLGEPVYAEKLSPDEFRLRSSRPAVELARLVRAGNPRPGAWCTIDGARLKVWRVETTGTGPPLGVIDGDAVLGTVEGGLRFLEVQPEGKPIMEATAWRNGRRGDVQIEA
jgi:methionyl-tRNA formyltransferase